MQEHVFQHYFLEYVCDIFSPDKEKAQTFNYPSE